MVKLAYFTVIFLVVVQPSIGQSNSFKIGKPSEEEISMKSCSFYPDAKSMILHDFGYLSFRYNHLKGWQYTLEIESRIKLFDNSEKDAGTVRIKYYSPTGNDSEETITQLKAFVINGNGKNETIKLDKESFFEKRLNDYWSELVITFPQVQEGSILDLSYTLTSDFLNNLKTWEFQKDIPVANSRFIYLLPQFFNYQESIEGSPINLVTDTQSKDETFTYTYTVLPNQSGGGIYNQTGGPSNNKRTGEYKSVSLRKEITANNVLPIEDEPYMNNRPNVPARIEFQLAFMQFPDQPQQTVATDYRLFAKELLLRPSFGSRLNDGGFANAFISELGDKTLLEKAQQIHSVIKQNMTWNGYNNFLSSDAGRKSFKDGKGDVADINLTYIAACRQAGLTCEPVLLSTRGSGLPHPIYPSFDRFNYVIALVQTENGNVLVDASSDLPFGSIPQKCRNGKGFIVNEQGGSWIELKESSTYSQNTLITYTISEEQIIGKISTKEEGYLAITSLSQYHKEGEEEVIKDLKSKLGDWKLTSSNFAAMKWGEPVKYDIEVTRDVDNPSTIYLEPMILTYLDENPFKRTTRISPIDFPYSLLERTIIQINLPEGYSAELPEPSIVKLPDDQGSYTYNATVNGNRIQIMIHLKQNETDFSPADYDVLKQFYQLAVDKTNEVIVIKKKP